MRLFREKIGTQGAGNGLFLVSMSPLAPSASLTDDDGGTIYPVALKLYNSSYEQTLFRAYSQQGRDTDNFAVNTYLEFLCDTHFAKLKVSDLYSARISSFSTHDASGTESPSGGIICIEGDTTWNAPLPTKGAALRVMGMEASGAPVSNILSGVYYGCSFRGVSHNGVVFSTQSLLMNGRCIDLVGVNGATWQIVGTAPWSM